MWIGRTAAPYDTIGNNASPADRGRDNHTTRRRELPIADTSRLPTIQLDLPLLSQAEREQQKEARTPQTRLLLMESIHQQHLQPVRQVRCRNDRSNTTNQAECLHPEATMEIPTGSLTTSMMPQPKQERRLSQTATNIFADSLSTRHNSASKRRKKVPEQGCKVQELLETPCTSDFSPCTLNQKSEILATLATLTYCEKTDVCKSKGARLKCPATRHFSRVQSVFLQPCNHIGKQFLKISPVVCIYNLHFWRFMTGGITNYIYPARAR